MWSEIMHTVGKVEDKFTTLEEKVEALETNVTSASTLEIHYGVQISHLDKREEELTPKAEHSENRERRNKLHFLGALEPRIEFQEEVAILVQRIVREILGEHFKVVYLAEKTMHCGGGDILISCAFFASGEMPVLLNTRSIQRIQLSVAGMHISLCGGSGLNPGCAATPLSVAHSVLP